jgi:protein TonB
MFALQLYQSQTRNRVFKERYPLYVRRAAILAIALHVLLFVLSPPFAFKPYELKAAGELEVIAVSEIEIPERPQDVPRPKPIVLAADDDPTDDVPVTTFNEFDELPYPPPPAGSGANEVFLAFDEEPEPIHVVAPAYPDLAREAGIEGTVRIKVVIGVDGKVVQADVISSEVTRAMELAALEAAKRCTFRPARQRHVPVPATIVIPYVFRLNE